MTKAFYPVGQAPDFNAKYMPYTLGGYISNYIKMIMNI